MPVPLKTISFLSRSEPVVRVGDETLPVRVTVRADARRMILRVDAASRAVRLTLPRGVPVRDGIAFAEARAGWIAARLAAAAAPVPFAPGTTIGWRGEPRLLCHVTNARGIAIGDEAIIVGGPAEAFASRLARALRSEARRLFAVDLADYAARAGLAAPPRLAVADARGRWGSCSAKSGIRLNWRLAMAPDAVRRSVVAHEVAHLAHMNHSPAFYAWLDHLYDGDRRAADRWLKRHGPGLMLVGFG